MAEGNSDVRKKFDSLLRPLFKDFSEDTATFLLIALGFCCYLVCIHIIVLPDDAAVTGTVGSYSGPTIVFKNLGQIFAFVLVFFTFRHWDKHRMILPLSAGLAACLSILVLAFAENVTLLKVFSFVAGFGLSIILLNWCVLFANLNKSKVFLILIISVLLNAILVALLSSASTTVLDSVAACCILISGFCLFVSKNYIFWPRKDNAEPRSTRNIPVVNFAIFWILFAGLSFIHGALLRLGYPVFSRWYVALAGSCVLTLLLASQLPKRKKSDINDFFLLIIAISAILIGFMFVASSDGVILLLMVHAVRDMFRTLAIVCLALIMKEYKILSFRTTAIGMFLFTAYPYSTFSSLFSPVPDEAIIAILIVLLVLCAIAICVSSLNDYLAHQDTIDDVSADAGNTIVQPQESASDKEPSGGRLVQLCQKYGLSEREQEILLLTVKGFTIQATADKLVLSPNTIKTHLKNIENKFGVLDKRSLIEFVFSQKYSDQPDNNHM